MLFYYSLCVAGLLFLVAAAQHEQVQEPAVRGADFDLLEIGHHDFYLLLAVAVRTKISLKSRFPVRDL